MSEVRCHCGFGRLEECDRFGHEQGSRLDHERVLRNLDRASKRLRKFKRAMANWFPHIDASETDNAIRAIYDENDQLRNKLYTAERKIRDLEIALRARDPQYQTTATNINLRLPTEWGTVQVQETPIEPYLAPDPPGWDGHTLCEGCGDGATHADNEGVPLCFDCWSECVQDAENNS